MTVRLPGLGRCEASADLAWIVRDLFDGHVCRGCGLTSGRAAISENDDVATGLPVFNWRAGEPFGCRACVPLIREAGGFVEMYAEDKLVKRWREPGHG